MAEPYSEFEQRWDELIDMHVELEELQQAARQAKKEANKEASEPGAGDRQLPQPIEFRDRTQNKLRPQTFDDIVGQEETVSLLRRYVDNVLKQGKVMDHVLITAPAGTGKTTVAQIIGNELDARCFQVEAPVAHDVLLDHREVMADGDVLIVDEIHMQAMSKGESTTSPEVFLHLLEDFVIATSNGMLPFPTITVIGATTDPGMLPDPFIDRFSIQPKLRPYTPAERAKIARFNAKALGMEIDWDAAEVFGHAAPVPRVINRFVKNAAGLGETKIDKDLAVEVVTGPANSMTLDGLTYEQQSMLKFLLISCKQSNAKGETLYMAAKRTIATGIGCARDHKALELRIEPALLERGLVTMGGRGRVLTEAGIERARKLVDGEG